MPDHTANIPAVTHTPEKIAYDLWCIQEDWLGMGRSLEGLDALLTEFHQRYPHLDSTLIAEGIALFLADQIRVKRERLTQRQRLLLPLIVCGHGCHVTSPHPLRLHSR